MFASYDLTFTSPEFILIFSYHRYDRLNMVASHVTLKTVLFYIVFTCLILC